MAKVTTPASKNTVSAKTPAKPAQPAEAVKTKAIASKTVKPAAAAPAKTALAKATASPKPAVKKVVTEAPAKVAANKSASKTPVPVKSKTDDKKTTPAKSTPAKAAAPAKKAAAPAKAVAPAKKETAPVKAAAPAKKPVAAAKPEPAPVKKAADAAPAKPVVAAAPAPAKKGKVPPKKTITAAAFAAKNAPAPSPAPAPTVLEPKKPNVVIAHRKYETKKEDDSKTMINYQPDFTRSILDQPEQQSGPVYRYSDEELNEFKELITGRLESARKELGYLQGLITRKDEAGTEDTENRYASMEDGSGAMEREQVAQLASRQIQFINHLEKAMIRIENKTYGICRVTGKLIDKARLRAVPHATLSIEAKKMMSK